MVFQNLIPLPDILRTFLEEMKRVFSETILTCSRRFSAGLTAVILVIPLYRRCEELLFRGPPKNIREIDPDVSAVAPDYFRALSFQSG